MLVDLHIHTSIGSPDSSISSKELIDKAKSRELGMICLTDHNSYKGFGELLETGEKEAVLVSRGIEVDTKHGHLLVYGADISKFLEVNKAILREQTEGLQRIWIEDLRDIFFNVISSFGIDQLVDEAHDQSGAVVLPHPFGEYYPGHTTMRYYLNIYKEQALPKPNSEVKKTGIDIKRLMDFVQSRDPKLTAALEKMDAIEVLNPSCSWLENQAAFALAEHLGKNMVGGSDAHDLRNVGCCVTAFPSALHSEKDLIYYLRYGKGLEPRVNLLGHEIHIL